MAGFKITECWMVIAIDDGDGDEGLPAIKGRDGQWLPMVGSDIIRVEELRRMAQQLANDSGKEMKLVKFKNMEVLEIFRRKPGKHEN